VVLLWLPEEMRSARPVTQALEAESSGSNVNSQNAGDIDSAADAGTAEYQPGHIGSSARRRGLLGV